MFQRLKNRAEDFFYKKIVRRIIFNSRVGRKSMMGYADSGINFDYLYRNCASGYTVFGKLIDRILLNLPSAKATQKRKENIEKLIRAKIQRNRSNGKKTRIVDLACGCSRYLVDAVSDADKAWVEALCIDRDENALQYGRKLAGDKPILYRRADLSKLPRYRGISRKLQWKPNLVIASGLFTYYDDAFFKYICSEVHSYLEDGGVFLFDSFEYNPSDKLFKKLGLTKGGTPWVLRWRSRDYIASLIKETPFSDVHFSLDEWGIFILATARKQTGMK